MTPIEKLRGAVESGRADAWLSGLYGHETAASHGAGPAGSGTADTMAARSRYIGLIDDACRRGFPGSADMSAADPAVLVSAPGRTELGGNHTDHNGGLVLAAAVDLDIAGFAAARTDMVAAGISGDISFSVDLGTLDPVPAERGTAAALVRGVAAALSRRGRRIGGFFTAADSRVPIGSGLSSSAAFEIFIGTIFSTLYNGGEIPPIELAVAGQEAENRYFGKPCGLMDQTASALGGAVFIDFRDRPRRNDTTPRRGNLAPPQPGFPIAESLRFSPGEQGYRLCIVNTGGSHQDLTDAYAAIPAEMKEAARFFGADNMAGVTAETLLTLGPDLRKEAGDRPFLRALHFTEENRRVLDMRKALEEGRMEDFLRLVTESGRSSFMYLQNCAVPGSIRNQEIPVALALTDRYLAGEGAFRIHRGGFAGTIQAYIPEKRLPGYVELMERYFGTGSVVPLGIRGTGASAFSPGGS